MKMDQVLLQSWKLSEQMLLHGQAESCASASVSRMAKLTFAHRLYLGQANETDSQYLQVEATPLKI